MEEEKPKNINTGATQKEANSKKQKKKKKNKKNNEEQVQEKEKPKGLFLLQFSKGNRNIVHALVSAEDVYWPSGMHSGQRQVLLNVDSDRFLATVLFSNENHQKVKDEFNKLKVWSFDRCCNEADFDRNDTDEPWILCQYIYRHTNVVYEVVNRRDTRRLNDNNHKGAVTYFNLNNRMYQAIVLKKSRHMEELMFILNGLKYGCEELRLPFRNLANYGTAYAIPPTGFKSLYGGSALLEESFEGEFEEGDFQDENMSTFERTMQDRVAIVIESLKLLRSIRRDIRLQHPELDI